MDRKHLVLSCVAGAGLVAAVTLVTLDVRKRNPDRDPELTTWEGKWEVPVVEGDHQSKAFVLAKNKTFRLRIDEDVWDFHEGESVTVRWEPGKVFVNDIQVVPDPTPRKVYPVSHVMKLYGNIPGVREYIAVHRGEASEDEVATRAAEAWFEKKQKVERQATDRYIELVKNRAPREAAEGAAEVLRQSGLTDSVGLAEGNPPESAAQGLHVYWHGGPWGESILLEPWRSEVAPLTVQAKRVYVDLVRETERLTYGENTLKVGFEGGSVIIDGTVIAKPKGGK